MATLTLEADVNTIQHLNPESLSFDEVLFQKMPALGEADYAWLVDDVAARGVTVPIEVTPEGIVVDGHNRVKAAIAAGLTSIPVIVQSFDSDEEATAHVFAVNLQRRHLNRTDKQKLIKVYLALDPYKSNRQVAAELGGVVDDKTVGAVREKAEEAGEIEKTPVRKGKDGKVRSGSSTRLKGTRGNPEKKLAEDRKNKSTCILGAIREVAGFLGKDAGLTGEVVIGALTTTRQGQMGEALTIVMPLYLALAAELGLEGYEYEAGTEEGAAELAAEAKGEDDSAPF